MLPRLHNDHKHIAVLLNLLKGKYQKLADGESVNFGLVRDVVEYMQSYTEHSHHPLEDIIYEYYLERFARKDSTKRLSQEHQKLVDASTTLATTLNLILNDIVVAKEKLIEDLKAYVTMQEEHLRYEEEHIFPLLEKTMTADDWQRVESTCSEKLVDDPLFTNSDDVVFEELRGYIQTVEPISLK
ncbi:hemerythrin domain-containing protein [Shewanella sp. C32]|uniref:Hemerythrin domain-containing protein n=1 Tax=Shewanella electrica TaxID=515560 RepID=A0ABT2FGC5_9GAMM|nr:hemerythrin domain-containing protein [Shewanella electrica]MCH1925441.1 hemerythrin domain-containing protein [Shewanella electrica]MCS4555266.1 hemerythrin domain-containing protein [Shewanella electrica]